jgi:hypothetical protein
MPQLNNNVYQIKLLCLKKKEEEVIKRVMVYYIILPIKYLMNVIINLL